MIRRRLRAALGAGGAFDVRSAVAVDAAAAREDLKRGRVVVAVNVAPSGVAAGVLVDGSQLLAASTALRELANLQRAAAGTPTVHVTVLYNPALRSADYMVPGLDRLSTGTGRGDDHLARDRPRTRAGDA